MRTYASRLVVPALRRTGHPFAASGRDGPSQKIELVFSASPETIRREPREGELVRSVGNRQDLAVCASMILMFLSPGSPYAARVSRCSAGINSRFSRSTASSQATILRATASVARFLLPFSIAF